VTDDDVVHEVARILAAGILRLRSRAALHPGDDPSTVNSPKSGQDCLALPRETVLTVHTG
jgi:hypothetical protein